MNTVLAVIGIIGGLLCATADCLLDIKGPDNKKIGSKGVMDSKWIDMAHWRFVWSDNIAMFAVPMYTCGFVAFMQKVAETHQALATTLTIIFLCGAMGGFMIHSFLCICPTIYQRIMHKGSDQDLAIDVIETIFRQIYVPFIVLYCMLVIIPALTVIVCICTGIIALPLWAIILNPVVFQIIGLLLRATKLECFIDAPSICAASLGLAAYGVCALLM